MTINYICVITVAVAACSSANADYYFVYSGDGHKEYLPSKVLRLVEPKEPERPQFQEMLEVKTLNLDAWQVVRAVPEHGVVLVANFEFAGPLKEVVVIRMSSPAEAFLLSIPNPQYPVAYRTVVVPPDHLLLDVRYLIENRHVARVYSLTEEKVPDNAISMAGQPPVSSDLYGRQALFQRVTIGPDRLFRPSHALTNVELPADPVPKELNLVETDTERGWSVIANEQAFIAFMSPCDRKGQQSKQLLVNSLTTKQWHLYEIEGADTLLRVLGDWLVGVQVTINPETEPERYYGMQGIRTGNVIMIHPATKRHLTVPIGDDGEVLLIEGATVTYRKGTQLFRARIGDNGFTDAQMLIDDPRVRFLQCAFKGPDKPE